MASTTTPIVPSVASSPASNTPSPKATHATLANQESKFGTYTTAPSPFDKPGADVVLRSSDNVDFYIYKAVLLLASDFFETMFSLNQPPPEVAGTLDGRPIIDVSETSDTLDTLLRFCYPVDDPEALTLAKLDLVLAAAIKYELRAATKILRRMLQTYVSEKPREVYALACRHSLEKEADMAAKRWKEIMPPVDEAADFAHTLPGATFISEMQNISAIAYYKLLSYLGSGKVPARFSGDTILSLNHPRRVVQNTPLGSLFTRDDADTILRSSDDIDFRVHKIILAMNDGDAFLSSGVYIGEQGNVPVLQVAISAPVLRELLYLCYPAGMHPEGSSTTLRSDVCNGMIQTALRFNMKTIICCIQRNLKNYLGQDHLSRYLIAARNGWDPEAQDAAKCLLGAPLNDVHSVELRHSVASHYHALLEFHHRCQMTLMQAHAKFAVYNRSQANTRSASVKRALDPVDVSEGQWKKQWYMPRRSACFAATLPEYRRSAPSVLIELAAEKYKTHSIPIDFPDLAGKAEELERSAAEAVDNLKVDLGKVQSPT